MTLNQDISVLGAVSPKDLSRTRVELHWLAQCLAAAGDAFLERAADDGQSNAAWSPDHSALLGRPIGNGARVGLRVADAELIIVGANGGIIDRRTATGRTLEELLVWLGGGLERASSAKSAKALALRDYGMPDSVVSDGHAFSFEDSAALGELAQWFRNSTALLQEVAAHDPRSSDVRCWPHHFDVGGIIMLDPDKPFEEARQLGFGCSPGDGSYDEPYYYVTPFPVPTALPELASGGHWHREGFTGAILTGTTVVAAVEASAQVELVREFLRSAVQGSLPLIS